MRRKILFSFLAGAIPVALFAFSTGPPGRRTGAPADGGSNCTACHVTYAPANSDPRGSVTIDAASYTPGVKQVITVTVKHPEASRWGFELTARLTSDETKEAGSFTADSIIRDRCDAGTPPCNGGREFAEHLSAPRTDVGAGFSFQVTWTPPDTDAGNVIFYAAGNAANGDGTPLGDRIYTTRKTVTPNRPPCALATKPSILGVTSAASFQPVIGPGGAISIFGTGFESPGAYLPAGGADLIDEAFPRQFSCLAVEVDGKRAPIIFTSDTQINAQAPVNIPARLAIVRVLLNPDSANQIFSNGMVVAVQPVSPAFFSFGGGAVAASVPNSSTPVADPAVVPGAVFAKPGDIVSFWATGLGPTTPALDEGVLATGVAKVQAPVALTIGGIPVPDADLMYVGLSPNSIDCLYLINARVPDGVPDGNATIVLQAAGIRTQDGLSLAVKR